MTCSIAMLLLLTAHAAARLEDAPDFDHRGTKGLAFLHEGHFLLTANTWTIALDIGVGRYIEAAAVIMEDVKAALRIGNEGILAKNGGPVDEEFRKLTAHVLEKEGKVVLTEASTIFGELWQVRDSIHDRMREKRGLLNFGGSALKFLFGTLDDEDLRTLSERMDNLEGQEQATVHLLKLQATVLNTTHAMVQANSRELGKVEKATKGLVAEVKSLSDELEESHKGTMARMAAIFAVDSSMRILEAALARMRADLNLFKQAWETTVNGRLSPYFLSPVDFHQTLTAISKKLPRGTRFPLPLDQDSIYDYYALAKVTRVVLPKKVRLFVEIPLQGENDLFSLYRVLPLPVRLGNSGLVARINPSVPYLAVSDDHRRHFEMPAGQLAECKEGPITVCPPRREVLEYPSTTCLYAVYSGTDAKGKCDVRISAESEPVFYRARWGSEWVYSLPKNSRVIQRCPGSGGQPSTRELNLNGTGVFSLPPTCSAYVDGHHLPPSAKLSSTTKATDRTIVLPSASELFGTIHEEFHALAPKREHLEMLVKETQALQRPNEGIPEAPFRKMMKETAALEEPHQWHSVRISTPHLGGGAAVLVAAAAAVAGYLFWRCRRQRTAARRKTTDLRTAGTELTAYAPVPLAASAPPEAEGPKALAI